jgi:DegV family protein with EDD domain
VILDEEAYRDGIDITLNDVYDAMRAGKEPGTSQISWADTKNLFSSIAADGDDFIYLSFSAAMSGTYDLAKLVREEVKLKYPSCRMEIVDSKGGSLGSGLIAIQLGLMNEKGASFDEMLVQCQWMTAHVKYAFTIDDLKCALRGGRLLAKKVGDIGSVFKIKPLMDVKNGRISLDRIVRGTKHSMEAIVNMVVDYAVDFEDQIIGITHADDPEKALVLLNSLKDRLPKCTFLCERIGSVLGSHLGIGGVGVFCMDKRPLNYHFL